MLPGYMRGGQRLKFRDVIHDPYWVQAGVSEVYSFKLSYDMRACKLGLPPLSLPESIAAHHYMRWGSVAVAERATQDLFTSVRTYASSVPRIRIFAAFLGQGEFDEKDASVADMLVTPHALSTYLDLLVEVHREIIGTKTWVGLSEHQSKGESVRKNMLTK